MRYDVIVVGAGPAGSTTARECASRGLSVLLLDRAEFPRDKPCGGGVTVRAAGLLPFSIEPVTERTINGMYFSVRHSSSFPRYSEQEIAYLTQRSRLDTFLVDQAMETGVTLRERTPIQSLERHETHIVVRAGNEIFEGSTLVAADGANGKTAKMAGVSVKLLHGIALEGNITPKGGIPQKWENMLGLDVGAPAGGYGWAFPKGDHLNIGLGGWKHVGPTLRGKLDELVRFYGFDPSDLWGTRGYPLPIRVDGSPMVDGNVLLVGDAAGLLDPFTGEGIYAAIWSGRAAAHHLAEYVGGDADDLNGYQLETELTLLKELAVSRQFHDLFQLTPRFYIAVERLTSILWGITCRILQGELTYDGIMKKHTRLATLIDFVSDLIRVTPFLQRAAGLRDPAPPKRFFLKRGPQR